MHPPSQRVSPKTPTRTVGREGRLDLSYAVREGRTLLTESRSHFPLRIFPAIQLEGEPCAYSQVINPSGGLVEGDRMDIRIQMEEETHVLLTTPSCTRVYHCGSQWIRQAVVIRQGSNSFLEWFPDEVIPFSGSRYSQSLSIDMDEGASCLVWDSYCTGRVERGECWKFTNLANELRFSRLGEVIGLERFEIQPDQIRPTSPGLGGSWNYFASLYFFSGWCRDHADRMRILNDIVDQYGGALLGGVSSLGGFGWVVRLAASSASDLSRIQKQLWQAIRREFVGLDLPLLRKY